MMHATGCGTSGRPTRTVLTGLTAGLLTLGMLLGGCQTGGQGEMELAAEEEAAELRSKLDQTTSALDIAEERAMNLEQENERLAGANADLNREVEDLQSQLAERGSGSEADANFGMPTTTRGSDIVVEVAGDVLFASGSASLRSESKQILDQIAQTLHRDYASNEIRIAGHTDTDKIRKSEWGTNERLSAERALAVESYLAEKGISRDRMHIAGYGPAKSKSSKQASRRVEIVVLGGAN